MLNDIRNSSYRINVNSILNDLDLDNGLNPSVKLQNYKFYLEKTEESSMHIGKNLSRINDFFKEYKQFLESSNQENISEPLNNLSNASTDKDLELIFEKVLSLNKLLSKNTKNYVKNFNESTVQQLEAISKNWNDHEKEQSKKSVEKAIRTFDSRKTKHKKSLRDLVNINYTETIEETPEEKSNLVIKLCEYLNQLNKSKTNTYNQLINCLLNSFKYQLSYLEESLKLISNFMQSIEQSSIIETCLNRFNSAQNNERDFLANRIKLVKQKLFKDEPYLLNGIVNNLNSNSSSASTQQMSSSFFIKSPNSFLPLGGSQPFLAYTHLLEPNKNKTSESPILDTLNKLSNNENSVVPLNGVKMVNRRETKIGYLYKRALHTRMGKSWLKRKCAADDGVFLIYHSDENKEPIKLNLALCEIKSIGDRKFQVFYPNERIFNFMADSSFDLSEWVTVLNQAKKNFYDKTNVLNEDTFINSIIDKVKQLDGNQNCCDCGAPDPDWITTNLGVLTCIFCCGVHREMGVHVAKTQSIKIDRLTCSQLIIASIIGNKAFNKIFEAKLDPLEKIKPNSPTDLRNKFIRDKYERHKFVNREDRAEKLSDLVDYAKANNRYKTFEYLLQLFGADINLLAPLENDIYRRNLLQLCLICLDDDLHLYIIYFIVQNKDFGKNRFSINYQDTEGNTALHFCAFYNRVEAAKILLKSNSRIELLNKKNQSAYDVAVQYSNFELAKQIKLQMDGKPVDCVKVALSLEDDYFSEGFDDADFMNEVPQRVARNRPLSMIDHSENQQNFEPTSLLFRKNPIKARHIRAPSDPQNNIVELKFNNNFRNNKETANQFYYGFDKTDFNESLLGENEKMELNEDINNNEKINHTTLINQQLVNIKNNRVIKCKAFAGYKSKNPSHLSFTVNDLIVVENKFDDYFWYGYVESRPNSKGLFPANLVNMYV